MEVGTEEDIWNLFNSLKVDCEEKEDVGGNEAQKKKNVTFVKTR